MNGSHHMHPHIGHMGHHMMMDSNTTEMGSVANTVQTTAATLLQAVVTTVMAGSAEHRHQSSSEVDHSGHIGHTLADGNAASESSHSLGDHSGDHMQMFFHFGVDTIILFKEWTTSSTSGLIGSCVGIFLLAVLYEGIKFFREYLFKKYYTSLEYSSVSVLGDDGKPITEVHKVARNRMFSWPHMLQSCLHVVQMVLSYFLMLIFMTFNVWLCLAVVSGSGTGYFMFGWRKATVVDITEHCH